MSDSVFKSSGRYFSEIFASLRSVLGAIWVAIPYLFSVGDLRREVTEQYPDPISSKTEDDLPPRTKGFIHNDIDRCTGCGDCKKICPANCIAVETEMGLDPSKKWVSVFDLNFGKCMFCGLCVEACPTNSLTHTRQYEGSVYELNDLVRAFGKGKITAEQKVRWEKMRNSEEFGF